MAIVMWLVATAVFFLFRVVPGDPAAVTLPLDATAAERAAYRQLLGLDRPLLDQYLEWLGGVVRGDLGVAITMGSIRVEELILPPFLRTLELAVLSVGLAILLAVPMGVLAAARPHGLLDRAVGVFAAMGLSLPSFWFAILLILGFSVGLKVLPIAGYVDPRDDLVGHLRHLVLPVATVGIITAAVLVRFVREGMATALGSDYITTARAKGAGERRLQFVHALPNAVLPLITASAVQLGLLVGGMVVVEQVFAWPGLGSLMVQAIRQRAFDVVQAGVLIAGASLVLISFAAEVLHGVIDPRLRGRMGGGTSGP